MTHDASRTAPSIAQSARVHVMGYVGSMSREFCAELSLAASEPLGGTAAEHTVRWLLIEVTGGWERKAYEGVALSPAVRARLDALAGPGCRVLLVRRPRTHDDGLLTLTAVCSAPGAPSVRSWTFLAYDDLLELDLTDAFVGGIAVPIFAVCTHGRRDACCARQGNRVYTALEREAPGRVWQCSHLGGHRFAATVVTLPTGIYYGRVTPEEAGAFVAAEDRGELYDLDRVRGATAYSRAVQTGVLALRRHLGLTATGAVTVLEGEESVLLGVGPVRYRVALERQEGTVPLPPSCGRAPELPVWWRAVGIEELADSA
jgi:(2Fe-2S) ferredoxin